MSGVNFFCPNTHPSRFMARNTFPFNGSEDEFSLFFATNSKGAKWSLKEFPVSYFDRENKAIKISVTA